MGDAKDDLGNEGNQELRPEGLVQSNYDENVENREQPCNSRQQEQVVQTHKCDLCDYETVRRHDLNRHIRMHTRINNEKNHKCRFCCESLAEDEIHQDRPEERTLKCYLCDFTTGRKDCHRFHELQHKDLNNINYTCDCCGYKSRYKSRVVVHKRMHQDIPDEEKFCCDRCKFKTIRKASLKRHLQRHEKRDRNLK